MTTFREYSWVWLIRYESYGSKVLQLGKFKFMSYKRKIFSVTDRWYLLPLYLKYLYLVKIFYINISIY